MTKDPIVVMKFGGSVLKDADGFNRAALIIKAEKRRKIVVVSAMAGVTDELYKLAETAKFSKRNDVKEEFRKAAHWKLSEIWHKHLNTLKELQIHKDRDTDPDFYETKMHLDELIKMIAFIQEDSRVLIDEIVSQGEHMSAMILSYMTHGSYAPAKKIITTLPCIFSNDNRRDINFIQTKENITAYLNALSHINNFITEGFVAGNLNGQTVTLGRNGSDYSAAIIGSVVDEVEEVQFWKDVPGVMTADPKLTSLATPLPSISYDEIIEATRLGAKILHPEAIAPLFESVDKKVLIKDINHPGAPGTEIVKKSINKTSHGVTMLTVKKDLAIFSIHHSKNSVEHLAPKVYLTLAQANIQFATVSQGFSDQHFTVIVRKDDFLKVQDILSKITGNNLMLGRPVAQIAVIGSNMRGKPGIAGRFLTALGNHGVNIRTIQQGSSECSMAATIDEEDAEKAVIAVHDAFDL